MTREDFRILRHARYYLIYNVKGKAKNHVHVPVTSRTGECEYYRSKKIVEMVVSKTVPNEHFFITSAIRLTLDENYKKNLYRALRRGNASYRLKKIDIHSEENKRRRLIR